MVNPPPHPKKPSTDLPNVHPEFSTFSGGGDDLVLFVNHWLCDALLYDCLAAADMSYVMKHGTVR